MKIILGKYTRLILVLVIMAAFIVPLINVIPVDAWSGTFTKSQFITVTDNSGTTRNNVPALLSGISGATYITSGYINIDGTDTAMTDNNTGDNRTYMMDTVQSALIVPNLPAYGSVAYQLLMGTSVNQTGFPIITGSSGNLSVVDSPNLEPSSNFSIEMTDAYIDTTAGANKYLVNHYDVTNGGLQLYISPTTSGTIIGKVSTPTASSNVTIVAVPSGEHDIDFSYYHSILKSEDFEWDVDGDSLATSGGSVTWSVTAAGTSRAEIDTAQFYAGTRSGRLYRDGANNPSASFVQTGGDTYIIEFRVRKDADSSFGIQHGNGTKFITVVLEADEDIVFLDSGSAYVDTGANVAINTWYLVGIANINFTAGTYDIYLDNSLIYSGATMTPGASIANIIYFVNTAGTSETWIDDVEIYMPLLEIDAGTGIVMSAIVLVPSIPNSTSNWTIGSFNYMTSYTETVNSTLRAWYQPTVIPTATIPDRSTDATDNPATINWGTNSGLTITYGAVTNAPSVQTNDVSYSSTTATFYGTALSLGTYGFVSCGFEWGEGTGSTYSNSKTQQVEMTTVGNFAVSVTGLSPNTTYHFRAFMEYLPLSFVYGSDREFTTLPVAGSSTTLTIKSAKMFNNYNTSGDMLLVAEIMNNYTYLYPDQSPREHFQLQLVDTNNTTILGASSIINWGDRPESIWFSPAFVTANLTQGSAYYVKVIGDEQSGNATAIYQLIPNTTINTDWKGSDLTRLDDWGIGVANNMGLTDQSNKDYYITYPTNQLAVINDLGKGYFTSGISNIGNVRPYLFATQEYQITPIEGTASSAWGSLTAWETFVGSAIVDDVTIIAVPFGVTGKDLLAGILILVILGCVMFVVSNTGGFGALGAVLIATPILWLGTYFSIMPVALIVLMVIFFGMFAIRQFVIKTL